MKIRHGTLRVAAASILMLGTVTLAASPVGTRGRERRGPRGRGTGAGPELRRLLGAISHRLDLTDEQAEKIRDIVEETRKGADIAREALAEARKTLHDAVASGAAEEQIRSSAEALGEALGSQAILRGKLLASVREVLTDEQHERLERLQERVGPLRGRSGRPESDDRPQRGRGNRWRQMGYRGARMQWNDRRGRPRWSDERLGWGRQSRGARFRPEMQYPRGHQRSRRQQAAGSGPADDRGRGFSRTRGPAGGTRPCTSQTPVREGRHQW